MIDGTIRGRVSLEWLTSSSSMPATVMGPEESRPTRSMNRVERRFSNSSSPMRRGSISRGTVRNQRHERLTIVASADPSVLGIARSARDAPRRAEPCTRPSECSIASSRGSSQTWRESLEVSTMRLGNILALQPRRDKNLSDGLVRFLLFHKNGSRCAQDLTLLVNSRYGIQPRDKFRFQICERRCSSLVEICQERGSECEAHQHGV